MYLGDEPVDRQFEIIFADWRCPLDQVAARVEEMGGDGAASAWIAQLIEFKLWRDAFCVVPDNPTDLDHLREQILLGKARVSPNPGRHRLRVLDLPELEKVCTRDQDGWVLHTGKFEYVGNLGGLPIGTLYSTAHMCYPLVMLGDETIWPRLKIKAMQCLGIEHTYTLRLP